MLELFVGLLDQSFVATGTWSGIAGGRGLGRGRGGEPGLWLPTGSGIRAARCAAGRGEGAGGNLVSGVGAAPGSAAGVALSVAGVGEDWLRAANALICAVFCS